MKSLTKTLLLLAVLSLTMFISCQKEVQTKQQQSEEIAAANNSGNGHLQQTKTFSSEVIVRWLNMQLELLRVPLAPGAGSQAADRALAYCGIAAYESVVPGMPAYQSLTNQLNGFPDMSSAEPGKAYHWAASANAALAEMNRRLFPAASAANKANIDNLENTLKGMYAGEVSDAVLARSIAFGKGVAAKVFAWAATDGSANINPPYVPPVGAGLWVSTPPNFPGAVNAYISQRRQMVNGSYDGAAPAPPPPYSTDPASAFYAMVKNVYDKSLVLTPAQTAMAIYHRDAPGYPGGGTFSAIISQVLQKAECKLDVAALAYVKVGIGVYEAIAFAFINKYTYNLVRPITYIRDVMGYTTWNALFNTPGHPEFPAAHATSGGVVATMLTDVFGENFSFILNHYAYIGLPARSYQSFEELGNEMGNSRVFGGIHYQPSVDEGFQMSKKVCHNILSKIKFLKE
ncbi:MAG TPA: vanadium-dependent haloperoxidase [Chitinophagaceae bacterium]